jgi:hypothetical protein
MSWQIERAHTESCFMDSFTAIEVSFDVSLARFSLITAGERTHGYEEQVGNEKVRGKKDARKEDIG